MEHVNHPQHYNSHPNGIECIDIIRHYVCDIANAIKYLWRAGLKVPSKQEQCDARIDIAEREEARPIGQTEMGMEDAEKEIEDLKKALWYIEDYRVKIPQLLLSHFKSRARMQQIVIEVTGHAIDEIAYCGYEDHVADAIGHLLCVGIIRLGEVRVSEYWEIDIREAKKAIQQRILYIEHQLLDKELESTALTDEHPAETLWRSTDEWPKDKEPILIKLDNGKYQYSEWEDDGKGFNEGFAELNFGGGAMMRLPVHYQVEAWRPLADVINELNDHGIIKKEGV